MAGRTSKLRSRFGNARAICVALVALRQEIDGAPKEAPLSSFKGVEVEDAGGNAIRCGSVLIRQKTFADQLHGRLGHLYVSHRAIRIDTRVDPRDAEEEVRVAVTNARYHRPVRVGPTEQLITVGNEVRPEMRPVRAWHLRQLRSN